MGGAGSRGQQIGVVIYKRTKYLIIAGFVTRISIHNVRQQEYHSSKELLTTAMPGEKSHLNYLLSTCLVTGKVLGTRGLRGANMKLAFFGGKKDTQTNQQDTCAHFSGYEDRKIEPCDGGRLWVAELLLMARAPLRDAISN